MNNNPGSWMNTLAKCGLLEYSTVKEDGDGHVSITITALTDMRLEPFFDKQSKEAASKILSLCEISAIWLTDNYGIILTSLYDGCTITIDELDYETFREENLDKESVRLDNELSEISWIGTPRLACTTSSRRSLEAISLKFSFAISRQRYVCAESTTPRSARGTSLGSIGRLRNPTMTCGTVRNQYGRSSRARTNAR